MRVQLINPDIPTHDLTVAIAKQRKKKHGTRVYRYTSINGFNMVHANQIQSQNSECV